MNKKWNCLWNRNKNSANESQACYQREHWRMDRLSLRSGDCWESKRMCINVKMMNNIGWPPSSDLWVFFYWRVKLKNCENMTR